MMDPTPKDSAEDQHYWERLYESALVEFLKRGWIVADATKHAAAAADQSLELQRARFK